MRTRITHIFFSFERWRYHHHRRECRWYTIHLSLFISLHPRWNDGLTLTNIHHETHMSGQSSHLAVNFKAHFLNRMSCTTPAQAWKYRICGRLICIGSAGNEASLYIFLLRPIDIRHIDGSTIRSRYHICQWNAGLRHARRRWYDMSHIFS